MRRIMGFSILALTVVISTNVWAYGTVRKNGIIGQDLEHERITRRAFSCGTNAPISDCIAEKTLNKIAGKKRRLFGTYGGVGYPDKLFRTKIRSLTFLSKYEFLDDEDKPKLNQKLPDVKVAHCDGGDFVPQIPGYPRTELSAQALVKGCRLWMNDHFVEAIDMAAGLVKNEKIVASEVKLKRNCITWSQAGSTAKCNVLTHFGIMLHASQDFYSHSNWSDKPKADPETITSVNPPGLAKAGPAPWLRMPISSQNYPTGLITGCWEGWPRNSNCIYTEANGDESWRTTHADLNKDHGVVDPTTNASNVIAYEDTGPIGPGKSKRGKINENFERSVHAAILDTRLKLTDLKMGLEAKYGIDDATLMFCALIKDDPMNEC